MDEQSGGQILPVAIEDEIKTSYLNYAMSVIVSRALPDVRDGLKPVHRRILNAMANMSMWSNTAPKKSGRIVGEVLGKFHPHGDQSIYAAQVRLAQDFAMRYPLIDGQGNYGSLDGDPPAAMRYTEARLTKIAEAMLRDLDKETVDFVPNYDDSLTEPSVLPAAFPFLLANGGTGIAVGMATSIPPHNLRELADAVALYIDNHDVDVDQLMAFVRGPDFPTAGIICGRTGIRDAYATGRGKIVMRARVLIEDQKGGKQALIVNEIPYLVNKVTLITRIADLVQRRAIEGISDLRDETDRDGVRIVIELKRGASSDIVLNQLFAHTQLQENFNVNCIALAHGRPATFTLKELIVHFVAHRREVIIRRTRYDLRKAEEREHILIGLKIALDNLDAVIELIRKSKDVPTAHSGLRNQFSLSKLQAQAILDMRLQRLTSLEIRKLVDELEQIRKRIAELKALLASEFAILNVVKRETRQIAKEFGDDRRTEIIDQEAETIAIEDLIQRDDMVVLISHEGYLKRTSMSAYKVQARGGRGSSSSKLRDNDWLQHVFIASTHDHIMFITDAGKAYRLKVHEIAEASRNARGVHIRNLLAVAADEMITTAVTIDQFSPSRSLLFATANGVVKKVMLSGFANARAQGIVAIRLDEGDHLVSCMLTDGNNEIVLVSSSGKALRYHEEQIRAMGRASHGVRGMRLKPGERLVGAVPVSNDHNLLIVSEQGLGKRVRFNQFTPHGRGTAGNIAYSVSEQTGAVIAALAVQAADRLIFTTQQGNAVTTNAKQISVQGKNARGVKLVALSWTGRSDFECGTAERRNRIIVASQTHEPSICGIRRQRSWTGAQPQRRHRFCGRQLCAQ